MRHFFFLFAYIFPLSLSFYFFCLFSLPFPFLLSFFIFSLLILILVFLLLHYSLPTFFAPHQKTIKKRLKTKHLEDERKQHQRPFISFFLNAALVGERTAGMEVVVLQHGGVVTEDEIDCTLNYSRAE